MWKPSKKTLRQMQFAIAALACLNTFIIVASFSFGANIVDWGQRSLMLPQTLVNIYALFFCYFKYLIAHLKFIQLGLSAALAGAYIVFLAKAFDMAFKSSGQVLLKIVEVSGALIVIILLVESGLSFTFKFAEPAWIRSAGTVSDQSDTTTETGAQIPQVHIYQPRISLTTPANGHGRRSSALSGTAAAIGREGTTRSAHSPVSVEEAFRLNISTLAEGEEGSIDGDEDEALELEELPKYQRKRPAQSATIIDLSNLQGVDPAVLTTILGESAQEIQNGVLGEAPGYSPLLSIPSPVSSLDVAQASTSGQEESEELETRRTAMTASTPSASAPQQSASTVVQVPSTSEPPVYMP